MEVETLKKSDQEHPEKISHLEKAAEVAASGLRSAKEQYREVAEAATPLVDVLARVSSSISHEALVARLQQPVNGLRTYISDMASTCVTHVLFLVKALFPK